MTTQAETSTSLLQRLRSTPKNIRRRFKNSHSQNVSSVPNGKLPKSTSPKDRGNILKRNSGNDQLSFNCKYLGKRTVYTLKPEDCYDFALDFACSRSDSALKVSINLQPKFVELSHLPSSPLSKQKLRIPQQTGLSMFRLSPSRTSTRPSSVCLETPTTVFDAPFRRPSSTDDSVLYISNESNNNSYFRKTQVTCLGVDIQKERSRMLNGFSDDSLSHTNPEKILLHEIAYCVTIPEKPRVFLLTSKGKDGLECRVFMFGSKEKAQLVKNALAEQFQTSYLEWQSRAIRRARRLSRADDATSRGQCFDVITAQRVSAQPSVKQLYSVIESSHPADLILRNGDVAQRDFLPSKDALSKEDELSSSDEDDSLTATEEAAMHREFTRRASCLASPEQLTISDKILMTSSEEPLFEKLSSDDFSTDDDLST